MKEFCIRRANEEFIFVVRKLNSFYVKKGVKFSTTISKAETDLTPEMISRSVVFDLHLSSLPSSLAVLYTFERHRLVPVAFTGSLGHMQISQLSSLILWNQSNGQVH